MMSSLSVALGEDQQGIKIPLTMVILEMNTVIHRVGILMGIVVAIIRIKMPDLNSQQQLTLNTISTIQKPK